MDYEDRIRKAQRHTRIFLFTFSVPLFILGAYLITPVATGNVIGGFSTGESSIVGLVLIVVAIFGFYFYSKLVSDYF